MAQENALSYRVSCKGSVNDWYWEVISDRKIIDRGLAPTRAEARTQALKVAASYAVWNVGFPRRILSSVLSPGPTSTLRAR